MRTFDAEQFMVSTNRQIEGQNILLKGDTLVPGHNADQRYFW